MVETLTLWSPHKLLDYLGALSEYAKCSQSSKKKIEILTLCPGYDGKWYKKPAYATVPFSCDGLTGLLAGGGEGEPAA